MQIDRSFVIYKHTFPNGKVYIGMTRQVPLRRWNNGHGYDSQPKMSRAISKYGVEKIRHELLACCLTFEEAKKAEIEFISKFDSVAHGYNTTNGGDGRLGVPCSEETKKKISRANKGRPNPYGTENLRRYREKHGAWNRGKSLSPAHAEKIADERKRRCNKVIVAFDPATHSPIKEFESCTVAATVYGVSKNVISRCAKGGRKTAAGYEWRYKNEGV